MSVYIHNSIRFVLDASESCSRKRSNSSTVHGEQAGQVGCDRSNPYGQPGRPHAAYMMNGKTHTTSTIMSASAKQISRWALSRSSGVRRQTATWRLRKDGKTAPPGGSCVVVVDDVDALASGFSLDMSTQEKKRHARFFFIDLFKMIHRIFEWFDTLESGLSLARISSFHRSFSVGSGKGVLHVADGHLGQRFGATQTERVERRSFKIHTQVRQVGRFLA